MLSRGPVSVSNCRRVRTTWTARWPPSAASWPKCAGPPASGAPRPDQRRCDAEVLARRPVTRQPRVGPLPPSVVILQLQIGSLSMQEVKVLLDPGFSVGEVSPHLFGSFLEHIGRAIYGGIYEPDHHSADHDGFRTDVIELVRELGVTRVRYPGGNFVSGFRWEDSVGPRSERPRRRELAWHSTETNEIGLHEFYAWTQKAGLELLYALNLGTRDTEAALDLLDYANGQAGSELADARIRNGAPEPFNIKTFYLGNEMDGPWQLGHTTASEYGQRAARTAIADRKSVV